MLIHFTFISPIPREGKKNFSATLSAIEEASQLLFGQLLVIYTV
jgi:hypothetical protein